MGAALSAQEDVGGAHGYERVTPAQGGGKRGRWGAPRHMPPEQPNTGPCELCHGQTESCGLCRPVAFAKAFDKSKKEIASGVLRWTDRYNNRHEMRVPVKWEHHCNVCGKVIPRHPPVAGQPPKRQAMLCFRHYFEARDRGTEDRHVAV